MVSRRTRSACGQTRGGGEWGGTGAVGHYRGQDVRDLTSTAFGEQGLARIEAYLTEAVHRAFVEGRYLPQAERAAELPQENQMPHGADQEYLLTQQYRDASNL